MKYRLTTAVPSRRERVHSQLISLDSYVEHSSRDSASVRNRADQDTRSRIIAPPRPPASKQCAVDVSSGSVNTTLVRHSLWASLTIPRISYHRNMQYRANTPSHTTRSPPTHLRRK